MELRHQFLGNLQIPNFALPLRHVIIFFLGGFMKNLIGCLTAVGFLLCSSIGYADNGICFHVNAYDQDSQKVQPYTITVSGATSSQIATPTDGTASTTRCLTSNHTETLNFTLTDPVGNTAIVTWQNNVDVENQNPHITLSRPFPANSLYDAIVSNDGQQIVNVTIAPKPKP